MALQYPHWPWNTTLLLPKVRLLLHYNQIPLLNLSSGCLRRAQTLPDGGGRLVVTIFGPVDSFMIIVSNVLRASVADDSADAASAGMSSFVSAVGLGSFATQRSSGGPAGAHAAAAAAALTVKECNSDAFVITIVTGEHELPGALWHVTHTSHVTRHTSHVTRHILTPPRRLHRAVHTARHDDAGSASTDHARPKHQQVLQLRQC
jgi:hypothetical protein